MSNAVVTSDAKHRQRAFKAMRPALQAIARDGDQIITEGESHRILAYYNLGARLYAARLGDATRETDYGPHPVTDLATYWWGRADKASRISNLANLANTVPKDELVDWSGRRFHNGEGRLTLEHWFYLMRIEKAPDRHRYLRLTVEQSLSARALQNELQAQGVKLRHSRGGGRRPAKPSSVVAGLRTLYKISARLVNYEETADSVFGETMTLAADRVDDVLLGNLQAVHKELTDVAAKSTDMAGRAQEAIDRAQRVLQSRPKPAEAPEPDEEVPAPEAASPAPRARAAANGKAAGNGHAGTKGAKAAKAAKGAKAARGAKAAAPKKKLRRPVAAAV